MSSPAKTNRAYWPLQILGWLAYGSIGYFSNRRFSPDVDAFSIAAIAYSGAALLFLSTHALRNYSKRAKWIRLSFGKLILRLAGTTLLISTASQVVLSLLMLWPFALFSEDKPYSFLFLLLYIFQTQIILMLWSLAYFSYHAIRNYKSEEIEKWRLQAAVKDAELIALKAQINPHFIFNCLNNIRALVLEDSEKARDAITKLSDLLRSSIQSNQAETTTIAEELRTVRDYLDLESIHMEKRLRFEIQTDPSLDASPIPPMSIQLLVENAIKHSLAKRPQGGSINVSITGTDTQRLIEVRNTGQLSAPNPTSTGIGLTNIQDRLKLLFGDTASLTLKNGDGEVLARMNLPTHTAQIP